MTDWAAAARPGGPAPSAPTRPTVSWPGRRDQPVPDADLPSEDSERLVSASRSWLPPLRLRSPSKAPRLTVSGFRAFTIPMPNYNGITER
jgi:hypothetical protein